MHNEIQKHKPKSVVSPIGTKNNSLNLKSKNKQRKAWKNNCTLLSYTANKVTKSKEKHLEDTEKVLIFASVILKTIFLP